MPTVNSEIAINAPVDRVYAIARNIERFPEFMEDVQSVKIIEQTPERQVSEWSSVIKEFNRTIRWTEVDYWDDDAKTCRWEQIEGDFSSYQGTWEFLPADNAATLARLSIDYEYNVPLIGRLIQSIIRKKMQENVEAMLQAIKGEAESA